MVTQSQNYSFIEQDPLLFNSATFRAALLRKVKSDSSALPMASGGGRLFSKKTLPLTAWGDFIERTDWIIKKYNILLN